MARTVADEGEAPVIVGLAEAAIELHECAIGSLPSPEASAFQPQAEAILSGLRKIQGHLQEAAGRARTTPSVMVALGEVRGRYDALMTRAAAAPGSTLGHELYIARRRAQLSVQEIATGIGLRADLIEALEAGQTPTHQEAATVKDLITALNGSQVTATNGSSAASGAETSSELAAWGEADS